MQTSFNAKAQRRRGASKTRKKVMGMIVNGIAFIPLTIIPLTFQNLSVFAFALIGVASTELLLIQ